MNVVVVESPSKAKTINKYLGSNYHVLASFGHVRDLPAKDGSVDPENNFEMQWSLDSDGEKRMKEIVKAVKGSDTLILATDPDREGEAISWHIQEELTRRKVLKDVEVQRVTFNEITKSAILDSFSKPRELDNSLIQAYLARRALDYLVGFSLSPVLWRKLPGSRSAGRVQSVVLRMICEREAEIEVFKPQEYWSVITDMLPAGKSQFQARLTALDGTKLKQFDLNNEEKATASKALIENASSIVVADIEEKETRRFPAPPFTTSTLQQEASRKLGFGAAQTMRVAQRLYEGIELDGETTGLITYMRTDGVQLSNDAIAEIRSQIGQDYGQPFVPGKPREYKSKAKNAQEAHEAVRPTSIARKPADLRHRLDDDQYRLYELIWKRTMACQMEAARLNQTGIDIAVDGSKATLRATGSVVAFEGFMKVYTESFDDKKQDDGDKLLPALSKGESLKAEKVVADQHFTQPPPRYTEASMVKRMEEMGIGRPSTYAATIQTLQDRNYIQVEQKRIVPEDRGRIVTVFLDNFFARYVEYDFTANLEEQLDDVSGGRAFWRDVLTDFWVDFKKAIDDTKELTITQVIDALDEALGDHFFPISAEGADPRNCPRCDAGRLGLKLGKTGGFVGCSNYPECKYTRTLGASIQDAANDGGLSDETILGQDPETSKDIMLKKGPYGWYVQLGLPDEETKEKPKRCSLPKALTPDQVTLEKAIALLSLPRDLGLYEGNPVQALLGRYGPYVTCNGKSASLKKDDDILTIGLDRAVVLIAEAPDRKAASAGKPVGDHPEDSKPITLHDGKYGPYVKHGRLNASLPKDMDPATLTVETAVEILAKQAEKKGTKKKAPAKKAPAKKAAADKETTAKKPAAKKPAAKKAPARKPAAKKKAVDAPADDVPF